MILAPDAAVPQRDALLSEDVVASLYPQARTCQRVYAKYRVGESLRVVYRLDGTRHVAARTFRDGESAGAYERAQAGAVPVGPLPAVLHAHELDAVFWTFPNDRKLATLPLLTSGSPELAGLLGRPCHGLSVVAYAAERSASACCLDGEGNALAYVKVHAGDGAEHERRQLAAAGSLVPRVLATSAEHGALVLEPVPGARLDSLRGAELVHGLRGLGAALARLHTATPVPDEPFTRLHPERLGKAVAVIARARPDAGRAAALVLASLLSPRDHADEPAVCVHGDANLRNAIFDGERVALLDLEHAAAGPAAADLGQLLAALRTDRVLGRITTSEETALADALLDGYAAVTRAPESLRWHTNAALLARVAQSAINRVREDVLPALVPLLEAAA